MKQTLLILSVVLFLCSCEKWNFKNDITSENDVQLNGIQKVIITRDNGLLIVGENDSKTTIIKTDANFRTIWRKDNYAWGNNMYGSWGQSSYWFQIVNMFQDDNDNIICIASVMQGGCVIFSSAMIIELNIRGAELKRMEIKDFSLYDAIKSTDGGYLLSGTKLLKLDKNFKSNWEKNYWAQGIFVGKTINTIDGRFALTCWNDNDESYLKVLDTNGDELESARYSYNVIPFNETGNDLIQLNDRGFIIAGRTRNIHEPWDMDCGVTRINSSGKKTWTNKFGTRSDEWLDKIIYSSDNELIIQGEIGFPNADIQKSILLRIDLTGNITDSCTVDRIEPMLYNPNEYFIKSYKLDDNYFRFTKIPFRELFNIAGNNKK